MKKLTKQLFKLLSMYSPSGKEWQVAKYLLSSLKGMDMDSVGVDAYGNIVAEKKYGDSGYTVLLSAHMDTVARSQPIPKWRKNKTEIYTSANSGALGGDDKCGLAAHLAVIRQLNKGTLFKGTVKVLFSRQEEIGCVGASQAVSINRDWFEDIDASIVIDRRGGEDIVVGSYGENFCHENYGQFWEDMSRLTGFKAYTVEGSISDTMIFSEIGINGVNLSAGYYDAHSSREYIKINELKRTVFWVCNALDNIEAYGKFPSFEYIQELPDFRDGWRYRWDIAKQDFVSLDEDEDVDDDTFIECAYCSDIVPLDDTIDIDQYTVCNHCAKKLEEFFV